MTRRTPGGRRSCGASSHNESESADDNAGGSARASPSRSNTTSESPGSESENANGSAGASPSHSDATNALTGSAAALPARKRPVHGVMPIPNQPAIVAVTVCTRNRKPWLANDAVHELLVDVWTKANLWRVGRYVVMPDHIHLFAGEAGDISLDKWMQYWKSQFTKRHGNSNHQWQTDHWDRRMRSAHEYNDAWNYVYQNPVRAELVTAPDQWLWSGVIHELRWD